MKQQRTDARSLTADQQKRIEEVCFRSLALIGHNCEYLEQHFDRTGADESTRQAVADINAAAVKLDRTLSEAMTLLEFLRGDEKPQLYPVDLCDLLRQVAAQADMIRAQLGVEIHLDYGGWTSCCALADRSDAELLCLHLLSNALRASREGGSVNIALRRTQTAWLLTFTDDGSACPAKMRRRRWKTAAAFWAGHSWGCCSVRSAAAGWAGACSWSLRLKRAPERW